MKRFTKSVLALLIAACLASCGSQPDAGAPVTVPDEQTQNTEDNTISDSGNSSDPSSNESGNAQTNDDGNDEGSGSGNDEGSGSGNGEGTGNATVVSPRPSSLPDPFNGLQAVSVAAENYAEPAGSVNVRNCGAAGDGVTDDFAAVSQAFQMAASSGSVLYFPAGTYYLSQRIVLNQDITILGESMDLVKIVFKDDAPFSPNEQYNQRGMITFVANALDAKGVTFSYYAENYSGYTKQNNGNGGSEGALFSVLKGSQVWFHNCRFLVEEKENPSVTCLWIKSEVNNIGNIRITSCDIRNNSASTVGGGVWISAHDSSDTAIDGIEVSNCSFYKRGNDEIFATWGYHISNVSVHNNSFAFENHSTQNDVLLSFGSPKEGRQECLKNVKFYDNTIMETGLFARVIAIQLLTADSDVEISGNRIMCHADASAKVAVFRIKSPGYAHISGNSVGVEGGASVEYLTYSAGCIRFSGNFFKTRNTGSTALIRTSHSSFYAGVDLKFENENYDLGTAGDSAIAVQISAGGDMIFDSCTVTTSESATPGISVQLIYSDDGYSYPQSSLTFTKCYIDTAVQLEFGKPSNTSADLSGSYIEGISIVAEGSCTGPESLNMTGTRYDVLAYNEAEVAPTDMSELFTVIVE
ncbi:MAG: glycoside hydrolase family 55 protein [Lachnospiraceae bacterium]|nr:glycoside hydrolase family 55 protein [Lachnospiraceae bacterium]